MYLNEQTQKAILNEMNAPRMDGWSMRLRRRGQHDMLHCLGWHPTYERRPTYTGLREYAVSDELKAIPQEIWGKGLRGKWIDAYNAYMAVSPQSEGAVFPPIQHMLNAERYRGQLDILRAIGYRPVYGEGFVFEYLEHIDDPELWTPTLPNRVRAICGELVHRMLAGGVAVWLNLLEESGLLEGHGYIIGWLNA